MIARRTLPWQTFLLALAPLAGGCFRLPSRALSVESAAEVLEGQRARVTVTVTNVRSEPIIPLAMALYARRSLADYFADHPFIAEVDLTEPLMAAEVRHLKTLGRIEAHHVRDGDSWRLVPHSRFLHPRILLPGQALSQDFEFQAHASHRRLLCVDLYYLPYAHEQRAGRLYAASGAAAVPPAQGDRHVQVFERLTSRELSDPRPDPRRYLLHRPLLARAPSVVTRRIRLPVRPRPFSFRDAARRGRSGARAHCYFSAAGGWVFDYDVGTWLVGPTGTTKLKGHYIDLIADLERRGADALILTAPRDAADEFLAFLQKAGYSNPAATTPTAKAAIPAANLFAVLQHAEALGVAVDAHTWRATPMPH